MNTFSARLKAFGVLVTIFLTLLGGGISWDIFRLAAQIDAHMTESRLIGGTLMIGFNGIERPPIKIKRAIQNQTLGGVILMGKNIQSPIQLRRLTAEIRRLSPFETWMGIDQEGGSVARLTENKGFSPHLSQREFTRLSQEEKQLYMKAVSRQLKTLGIQLNFSPVVDIHDSASPIIGQLDRAYSADVAEVIINANTAINSMLGAQIVPVMKHFPGQGTGRLDTHTAWVDATETWRSEELAPFEALLNRYPYMGVMVSHIFHNDWDPQYPASLSRSVILNWLKEELGFKGVVISDDLQMAAISQAYTQDRVVELAILAGNDILLFVDPYYHSANFIQWYHEQVKHLWQQDPEIGRRLVDAYYRRTLVALSTRLSPFQFFKYRLAAAIRMTQYPGFEYSTLVPIIESQSSTK